MENHHGSSNFMLYLMLIICCVIAAMNTLEIYRMTALWKNALNLKSEYFEVCVKNQYIVKTFFCIFSFLATMSALILTIGLIVDYLYFAKRLMESYMNFVYYIFGPSMLISCILALINWKETVFVCSDDREKHFSLSNASSIIFCFLIGGVITLVAEFYSTMTLYSDTITNQPNGSKTLYKLFWFVSFKMRSSARFINNYRHRDNITNNSNNNTNLIVAENHRNLNSHENILVQNETDNIIHNVPQNIHRNELN